MARRTRRTTTNTANAKKGTKTMAKATSTKKATTNKETVKETETMANTMKLSAEEMAVIKAMRSGKAAPKVETKQATTKQATKQTKKTENKAFDSDLYYSIAETLGVLGKNGVYRVARPVVYELMELDKIKKSDLTKAKAKIVAIATEKNLGWLLEKLGVEAENEAENVEFTDEEEAI